VVRGALEIAAAVYFRRILDREWALITTGSLSILLGLLLAVFPWAGALAMVLLIAAFGLVMGVRWIILAFRIHGLRNQFEEL
jgi:uncharacterized membrane protein HdeD (DUF308 family)